MIRVLMILQSAFSLWMLIDAIRRRCPFYWYILILMPFGEIAYFFMVKIHDPEWQFVHDAVSSILRGKTSLEQLRYRQQQTPSFENTVELARALYNAKNYEEAAELFSDALRLQESEEALYGLSLSLIGLERYQEAIERLERLIERRPDYEDYDAWPHLALALTKTGRGQEAVPLLEGLVKKSPRLNHRMLLAHYLMRNGQAQQAKHQLETGLNEYQHAPRFLKKRQRSWARQAKKMLQQAQAQSA